MEVFRGAERSHTNILDMITAIPPVVQSVSCISVEQLNDKCN